MRLLLVSSEFPPGPGGIGTHAYQLAHRLQSADWNVKVVTPQNYVAASEIEQFNRHQPFEVVQLGMIRGVPLEAAYRLVATLRVMRDFCPDLIVATGQRAVWIGALATKLFRQYIPLAAIGHGSEFGMGTPSEKWLTRWAFQQAEKVICVSQFTRNYMLNVGVKPRNSLIIPNGADETAFKEIPAADIAAFRAQNGFQGCPLLLTVGNVTERKGQHIVIRALPQVLEKFPSTHYLIAGLPTQKKQFAQLAAQLDVADHVHFLGRVASGTLLTLLNACDVFVMTSLHTRSGDFEGYGIAAVEAALCRKPAIVADQSGLAEAVIDQQTGLIVPQNDTASTAQAIVQLLGDDALTQRLGSQARQHALSEQTWTKRIEAYDGVFKRLVSQGRQ